MNSKILILQGHPNKDSYNYALGESYKKGAIEAGAEVEEIHVSSLNFDPDLHYAYQRKQEMEEDLLDAQQKILWANHIVIVYPSWWGSVPATLKGFFDRILLPGFAFKHRKGSHFWDKLLKGRSSRIIITMDTPVWYYWLVYGNAGFTQIKKGILNFCGISPVKITAVAPIRTSTEQFRKKWLQKTEQLGRNLK